MKHYCQIPWNFELTIFKEYSDTVIHFIIIFILFMVILR